jgi:hypothetical protein
LQQRAQQKEYCHQPVRMDIRYHQIFHGEKALFLLQAETGYGWIYQEFMHL